MAIIAAESHQKWYTRDVRFHIITWNVAGRYPPKNLKHIFGEDFIFSSMNIFAVGLQELPLDSSLLVSRWDIWLDAFTAFLNDKGYMRVTYAKLLCMGIMLFAHRDIILEISHVITSYARTGYSGLLGNKGSVAISASIAGMQFVFVNCHFSAGQSNENRRLEDYVSINERLLFQDPLLKDKDGISILEHDYVFWFGDLNFRVNLDRDKAEKLCLEGKLEELSSYDSLKSIMKEDLYFADFHEGPLTFQPTYKFDVGSDAFDTSQKRRVPSWCDRILYFKQSGIYQDVDLRIKRHSYHSLSAVKLSDHKPVFGSFSCLVFDKLPGLASFQIMPDFHSSSEDLVFTYVTSSHAPLSPWDYVALFKENFAHFGDHVVYIWVSNPIALVNAEESSQGVSSWSLKFPGKYLSVPAGKYLLGYYSYCEYRFVALSSLFSIIDGS